MIATVRTGKRRVGMSSLSGSKALARRGTSRNSIAREKAKPGVGPPSMREHAPAERDPAEAVARRAHVGQRAPAVAARGSNSSTSAIVVPPGSSRSPPNTTMRPSPSRTAAIPPRGVRSGGSRSQRAPARVVALGVGEVAGVAPGQHVEAPAARDAGRVVARAARGSSARGSSARARSRRSRASAASPSRWRRRPTYRRCPITAAACAARGVGEAGEPAPAVALRVVAQQHAASARPGPARPRSRRARTRRPR